MVNEITTTVIGNLTSDPELRYTQNGLAVANFTIASTPRVFDRDTNQFKDGEAVFLRSSIWREHAEHVASSLKKGQAVIAQGQLKQRSYETKPTDGSTPEKRTVIEFEVLEIGPSLRYGTTEYTKSAPRSNGAPAQAAAQPAAVVAPAATVQAAPVQAQVAPAAVVDNDEF